MKFRTLTTVSIAAVLLGGAVIVHAQEVTVGQKTNGLAAQNAQLEGLKRFLEGKFNQTDSRLDGIETELGGLKSTLVGSCGNGKVLTGFNANLKRKCVSVEVGYDSCNNPSKPETSTNKPCAAQFYRCPSSEALTSGGAWASFGCIGQLSSVSQCVNIVYANGLHRRKFDCTPVSIVVK